MMGVYAPEKIGASNSSRRRTDTPRFAVPLRLTRRVDPARPPRSDNGKIPIRFRPGPGKAPRQALNEWLGSGLPFLPAPAFHQPPSRFPGIPERNFLLHSLAMQFIASIPRRRKSVKGRGTNAGEKHRRIRFFPWAARENERQKKVFYFQGTFFAPLRLYRCAAETLLKIMIPWRT